MPNCNNKEQVVITPQRNIWIYTPGMLFHKPRLKGRWEISRFLCWGEIVHSFSFLYKHSSGEWSEPKTRDLIAKMLIRYTSRMNNQINIQVSSKHVHVIYHYLSLSFSQLLAKIKENYAGSFWSKIQCIVS